MEAASHIKLNWHPVRIPKGDIRVYSVPSMATDDLRRHNYIRRYVIEEVERAVVVGPGEIPDDSQDICISVSSYPKLVSTLVFEGILNHFSDQGCVAERSKGEGSVFRTCPISGLPASIKFFEGLTLKPFYVQRNVDVLHGMVIAFRCRQEFAQSMAKDRNQCELARRGLEVYYKLADGTSGSGRVIRIEARTATVERHGISRAVPLETLRVRANYNAISAYMDIAGDVEPSSVVRMLQIASLSLTKSGYANVFRLANSYDRVAGILGRSHSGNLNFMLSTACQCVVSLETEPADVKVLQK